MPDTTLDTLGEEFDALLAQMQTPKARAGMKAAFDASGRELGQAAVATLIDHSVRPRQH
jgi:hypothetical protein